MFDSTGADREGKKSLGGLLASLPELIAKLIRGEIRLAKAEFTAKLKAAGIGIGLLAGGALFGFLLLETLVAAAVLATATVFAPWLAALLVAAALLVITAILVLVGLRSLKKGVPPVPTETVANVKHDVEAVKGEGRFGSTRE